MNRHFILMKTLFFAAIFGIGLLSSCGDKDKTVFDTAEITNSELKAVLIQKGFNFDAAGNLVQDEKVLNTASLDLSGCNLTDVSGLDVFPKLTDVNLANNKLTFAFDFAVLPKSVTGIDLSGNEIYEYNGLVSVEVQENGDEIVTLLRDINKLYLPESAKHNCLEIVYLFNTDKNIDLKMTDNGQLAAYNTLREVPDEKLRTYLKTTFPSMFDKTNTDLINIANRMNNALEAARNINPSSGLNVENVEGSQYIAMNPSFKGVQVRFSSEAETGCELKYYRIPSGLNVLRMKNVSTTYINYTDAKNLYGLFIHGDNNIESIDFSISEKFGQRGVANDLNALAYTGLQIGNCPKLKTIKWNRAAQYSLYNSFYNLPLLEELDLSNFKGLSYLVLGNLSGLKKLAYYTPDAFYYPSGQVNVLMFVITAEIYARTETKTFLDAYHEDCRSRSFATVPLQSGGRPTDVSEYDWTKDY